MQLYVKTKANFLQFFLLRADLCWPGTVQYVTTEKIYISFNLNVFPQDHHCPGLQHQHGQAACPHPCRQAA